VKTPVLTLTNSKPLAIMGLEALQVLSQKKVKTGLDRGI